jgi:hypothetical protein
MGLPTNDGRTKLDFSAVAIQDYRSTRIVRYTLAAVLAALVITIVLSTFRDILGESDPTVRWLTTGVVILLGAVAVFVYWIVFYFTSPGADSIEFDSEGITLVFPRAKQESRPWKDRRIRMRLILSTRAAAGFNGAAAKEVATLLWGRSRKFNRVTPEVVHAVVAAAEENGLSVRRRSYPSGGFNRIEFVVSATKSPRPSAY